MRRALEGHEKEFTVLAKVYCLFEAIKRAPGHSVWMRTKDESVVRLMFFIFIAGLRLALL